MSNMLISTIVAALTAMLKIIINKKNKKSIDNANNINDNNNNNNNDKNNINNVNNHYDIISINICDSRDSHCHKYKVKLLKKKEF